MKKRIAVIGSGIAGNGAAWALVNGSDHDVTLFEASPRPGGHSATIDVDYDGAVLPVDTGFIVYNEPNYPNFTRLLAHLNVETQPSDMSFSVSDREGALAWTSRPADFFGGRVSVRAGIPSPVHLRVLRDVIRFNRMGVADLHEGRLAGLSLGQYLDQGGFSRRFKDEYVIAMGSAIWSMPPGKLRDFPAETFLSFFENHRLMRLSRPVWRTVKGGSRAYVDAMMRTMNTALRLDTPIAQVARDDDGVLVAAVDGRRWRFDEVVMACHSDQSLAIIGDASERERALLAAVKYSANEVVLHRDASLMPARRSAWASWNVFNGPVEQVAVTYWMNALQGIDESFPLFVSLNPPRPPRPELTFARFSYEHPMFDERALAAQAALPDIQGRDRLWFCGAWTRFGFHEDGLLSGLSVAEALGAEIPWRLSRRQLLQAAE